MPRREPYTEIGIRRLKCFRCKKNVAEEQWQVCADGRVYRPICVPCDIALNKMVLRWMGDPDWKAKIEKYEKALQS